MNSHKGLRRRDVREFVRASASTYRTRYVDAVRASIAHTPKRVLLVECEIYW